MATIAINFGTGQGGAGFAQVILQSLANFGETNAQVVDYALTNQNSPLTPQPFPLVTGENVINQTNCPALANAGGLFICPGVGNGSLITLKGASGDTGIVLNLTAPTFIPFNVTPPTSLYLDVPSGACPTMLLVWV